MWRLVGVDIYIPVYICVCVDICVSICVRRYQEKDYESAVVAYQEAIRIYPGEAAEA